jgi:monoamine oxidase
MRDAARKLVMGHVARVNIVLKERFWEEKHEKLSFVHTPERSFNVWWTQFPLQAPVLTAWSGGPPALELTQSGTIEETAVTELRRAFGMRRSKVESVIESIHTYDWSSDRNFRGAYSYVGVGGAGAQKALARSFDGRVFLAGEATDPETSGTVEGALATGKRAAAETLRTI